MDLTKFILNKLRLLLIQLRIQLIQFTPINKICYISELNSNFYLIYL